MVIKEKSSGKRRGLINQRKTIGNSTTMATIGQGFDGTLSVVLLTTASEAATTVKGIDGCALRGQGVGHALGRRRAQGSGASRCLGDGGAAERAARRRAAVVSEGASDEGGSDRGSSEAAGRPLTGRAGQSDRGAGADGERVAAVPLAGAGGTRSRAQGVRVLTVPVPSVVASSAVANRAGAAVGGSNCWALTRRVGRSLMVINGKMRPKCAAWHARGVDA